MKHISLRAIALSLFFILSSTILFGQLSRISVDKNRFVDTKGQEIVFKGYSSSDPDKLKSDGMWNKKYFNELKAWGANIVRFPVHPSKWRARGQKKYLKLLDKGIQWAEENGIYVIMDWHSIGNLKTLKYQDTMYYTTPQETHEFWEIIAKRYGKNPTVAFYELFNEPTTYHGKLGECSWEEWSDMNMTMINIVRTNSGEGIPLVAGFNWAFDLTEIAENPIPAGNIGYVSHPYPQKVEKPWEDKWYKTWGYVKEKYPLILTEIGYSPPDEPGAHVPVISDPSYADEIVSFSKKYGLSYVVWVFDQHWSPRLYKDKKFTPSPQGAYFKNKLLEIEN